jgi:nucleoid DNA-binding protein
LEKKLNKLELISALREKTDLSKPEASTVVELFVGNMADALAGGGSGGDPGIMQFLCQKI